MSENMLKSVISDRLILIEFENFFQSEDTIKCHIRDPE